MKPIKERIKIYLIVLAAGLIGILGLLLTGYDYTRARGFFLSEKREVMSFSEALATLPSQYVWYLLAFVVVIGIVELCIFIATFIKDRFF